MACYEIRNYWEGMQKNGERALKIEAIHDSGNARSCMARTYRDLLVWQKAKVLAVEIYRASETFPRSEIYGLTSQLRRAAVSVVSNIAEGQGRLNRAEFRQFLGLSRGSLLELDTQILIAKELGYLETDIAKTLDAHIYQVLGLLDRLIASVQLLASKK